MSITRRGLLGFFAGLPLALRSMASEPARLDGIPFDRLLNYQWVGPRIIHDGTIHPSAWAAVLGAAPGEELGDFCDIEVEINGEHRQRVRLYERAGP